MQAELRPVADPPVRKHRFRDNSERIIKDLWSNMPVNAPTSHSQGRGLQWVLLHDGG